MQHLTLYLSMTFWVMRFTIANMSEKKKLTLEESLELEGPLTVFEVNKSLKKCKKRSAPGEDGWCNRSIEHFWNILKYPLVASFNNMTENESLSLSFSRVNIRLIPKKGSNSIK